MATPAYIFTDLTVFLSEHVRRGAAKLPSWDYPRLRKLVLGSVLIKRVWCNRRGEYVAWASLADLRAMLHIAGVPCVDHSSMGKRKGKEGKTNIVFYSWCAMRRVLREPIVILENVEAFGEEELALCLGDLYHLERIVVDAASLGCASHRRRQFVVLRLLELSSSLLSPDHTHRNLRDISGIVRRYTWRTCGFDQSEYIFASERELRSEREWKACTDHTRWRHDLQLLSEKDPINVPVAERFATDDPESYEFLLHCRERSYLQELRQTRGDGNVVVDLNQSEGHQGDPRHHICCSPGLKLSLIYLMMR